MRLFRLPIPAFLAALAIFAGPIPAHAKHKSQKIKKDDGPNNGVYNGRVSTYMPCHGESRKECDPDMEGRNEVRWPSDCPGMKPVEHAYQNAAARGKYVVAVPDSFRKKWGPGAEVQVEGIPGVGVACDRCPGCEKAGKILDVASNRKHDRLETPGHLLPARKITIVKSKLKQGSQ